MRTRFTALTGPAVALLPVALLPVALLPVALLPVALLSLAACSEQQQTATRTYDVTGAVGTLAVSSLGGRITVTAGTGDTVHVTETVCYTGPKPAPQHNLAGSDLTFTSGCQGHHGNCGVDYHLEVPAAVQATLDSAGGTISITGLAGELHLTSGGGAVDATAITPATVTARTGGGTVQLTFAKSPDSVQVDSAGGDVTLRLPSDKYNVDAQADGGTTTVNLPTDTAAPHKIDVHSGGGSIVLSASA
ncbi:DUF4097 family beta strand repeat-containing protein [Dactylosporangium sp. NPDC051541]|uniref:DUF4097 family beta strand repeat-containing protein n=1 Tax=Dactylosporangium sp. NPDC051541 TaxID=3363977 RepID=UPI0037B86F64